MTVNFSPIEDDNCWDTCIITLNQSMPFKMAIQTIKRAVLTLKESQGLDNFYVTLEAPSMKIALKTQRTKRHDSKELFKKELFNEETGTSPFISVTFSEGFLGNEPNDFPQEFFFMDDLSALTIDIFSEADISKEFVFLYALYLHFGWIKIRHMIDKESIADIVLKGYCWFNVSDLTPEKKQVLEASFAENEEYISDCYLTVMSRDIEILNRTPSWFKSWLEMCIERIHANTSLFFNEEYQLEMSYFLIPSLINRHLGISGEELTRQTYYINMVVLTKTTAKLSAWSNSEIR